MENELKTILNLLNPDLYIINKGRERQDKIWKNQEPDYLPIIIPGQVSERQNFPSYNMREQFYNKEKMLIEQLWGLISDSRGKSDAQLSIRVNLGTGVIPSIFGLEQIVFEDKMPWLSKHLSKENILSFEFPKNIEECGLIPRVIEYIRYFKEVLQNKAKVFMSDTQGPFDIAHLIRGEEIFTDIYDDPDFCHRLMQLSTQAYIEVTKILKEVIGEDLNSGYHRSLYMGKGGVRICEDTTTLLSPSQVKEFVIPYIKEALKPFGGGWIHFCGNGNHILDLLLSIEEVRGINLGNPEIYDCREIMRKFLDKGKFYCGGWPKAANESIREYLERILYPLNGTRKGLIFVMPKINEKDWQDADSIINLWHSLHG